MHYYFIDKILESINIQKNFIILKDSLLEDHGGGVGYCSCVLFIILTFQQNKHAISLKSEGANMDEREDVMEVRRHREIWFWVVSS